MVSFDTNVVLRLLLRDVPDQTERIIRSIEQAKSGSIMIADAVFFEVVWVLSGRLYNFDRPLIGRLLLQVTAIPQVNCNRNLLEQAIPLYVTHPEISFIDSCLAVYAKLNDAVPLLSFDKKLIATLPNLVEDLH